MAFAAARASSMARPSAIRLEIPHRWASRLPQVMWRRTAASAERVPILRDGFPATARPPLTPVLRSCARWDRSRTRRFLSSIRTGRADLLSVQSRISSGSRPQSPGSELGYIGNVSHHLTANDFSLNQVPAELMGPPATPRSRAGRFRSSAM